MDLNLVGDYKRFLLSMISTYGVTVVSKNMAMSLPDSPPLNFPVNKMTSK
jgi:hypothetical protein